MELNMEEMLDVRNSAEFYKLLEDKKDCSVFGRYFTGLQIRNRKFDGSFASCFCNCIFHHCNFSYLDMSYLNFTSVIFVHCNLRGVKMLNSTLDEVQFKNTFLDDVDFELANINNVEFPNSTLIDTNFHCAGIEHIDFSTARVIKDAHYLSMQCPEEGSFIGFKKALSVITGESVIVKLLIPADAKRSSATTRKCRCSKAEVLDIYSVRDRSIRYSEAVSKYSYKFTYKIGETVAVDDFDSNRWRGCTTGIHFFITEQEAINY